MSNYINSKGQAIDPKDMPIEYIERALAKAKRDGNDQNVKVLEDEIASRQ